MTSSCHCRSGHRRIWRCYSPPRHSSGCPLQGRQTPGDHDGCGDDGCGDGDQDADLIDEVYDASCSGDPEDSDDDHDYNEGDANNYDDDEDDDDDNDDYDDDSYYDVENDDDGGNYDDIVKLCTFCWSQNLFPFR